MKMLKKCFIFCALFTLSADARIYMIGAPRRVPEPRTYQGPGGAIIGGPTRLPHQKYTPAVIWDSGELKAGLAAFTRAKIAMQTSVIGQNGPRTYSPLPQTLISTFEQALSLVYQAYKTSPWKAAQVDAQSSSNYLVIIIKTLFEALRNNIQSLKQTVIQARATGNPYESLLNQLSQQVAHYDQVAQSTQQWIHKNWKQLYDPYESSMRGLAFSIYAFVLNDLANRPPATLTPDIATQAENYFAEASALWDPELTIQDFATPQIALTSLHTSYGTIEHTVFQNLLNDMKAEGDINTIADIVGPQNLNIGLLNQAAPFLNKAAQAFSTLTDSDSKSLYNAYTGMYTNIQNALNTLQQAQSAQDAISQVSLINEASTQLAQGGVQWLWQNLNRAVNLIQGRMAQEEGQKSLSDFVANAASPLKNTQKILSQGTGNLPVLTQTFSNLAASCKKALSDYQESANFYNIATQTSALPLSNGPLLSAQQQIGITESLQVVTLSQLLTTSGQAADSLSKALTTLSTKSPAAVEKAQELAATALSLAVSADAAYSQAQKAQGSAEVETSFSFYALFTQGMAPFIGRYMAKYYEQLASTIGDSKDLSAQALKAAYYQAAFFYQNYLTPDAKKSLLNRLKAFTGLVESAQKSLNDAKQTPGKLVLWDQALNAALIVYTLWQLTQKAEAFSKGPELYQSCLEGYIQSTAFKSLSVGDQSIIYYRLFLFLKAQAEDSASSLDTIEGIIEPLYSKAQSLWSEGLKPELDAVKGYDQALTSLNKLTSIGQQLSTLAIKSAQAWKDQQTATPEITSPELNLLLNNNEVYSSPLLSQLSPLDLSQLTQTRASLYQKQGDWAIQKASESMSVQPKPETMTECSLKTDYHGIASAAYSSARAAYLTLGNTTLAQTMLNLSDSEQYLAIADLVGNAPRPTRASTSAFGDTLGSTDVYAQYFLSPWIVEIPASPTLVPAELFQDFENYKKNPELKQKVVDDLKDLAATLYLYQRVSASGLTGTFTSYLDAIQDPNFSVSDKTLTGLISDSKAYRLQLGEWIDKGIEITQGTTIKTTLTFLNPPGKLPALVYCNLPVMAAPWGESANQALVPTAVLAYGYALRQYESFQGTTSLQQVYAKTKTAQLQKFSQQSYLSQAYSLLQKALYMQGEDIDETLIALFNTGKDELKALKTQRNFFKNLAENTKNIESLDKTNPQTIALLNASTLIQDYYSVATTYANAAATQGPVTGSGLPAAQGAMGYLYELQGDFIKQCLVGQPIASQYQAFVTLASKLYTTAQGAYQQAKLVNDGQRAQVKQAALFESVGNAYYTNGYFISAIPSFNSAQQLYLNAFAAYQQLGDNDSAQNAQQKGLEMGLQALNALFQGAIEFFAEWYATRWSGTITLPSGQTVPSFEQLLADCSSFAYTDEEQNLCQNLNSLILDSLIYLTSIDTTIAREAQSGGVTLSNASTTDTKKLATPQMILLDPRLQAYLNTHMPRDTKGNSMPLTQALVSGSLNAGQIRTVLTGLLLDGQTNIPELAQNKELLATSLTVTKLWTDYVFQAIASTYIQNYLSSVCAQGLTAECLENQYGDLIDAMTGEEQNILAPAEQYVG